MSNNEPPNDPSESTMEDVEVPVDSDLHIADQYMSLGKALKLKGDYASAIQEMSKALDIRRRVVGKDHPDTASAYYQLGICHTQAKNYDEALTELKRALTLGRICWGKTHEDTGCTYYQLGIVLNAKEEYDLGLRELRKAASIFENILGDDHEATARTYHHIGDALVGKNDSIGGLVQYARAFAIQVAQLGRQNPQTMETFRKLDLHMRKSEDWNHFWVWEGKAQKNESIRHWMKGQRDGFLCPVLYFFMSNQKARYLWFNCLFVSVEVEIVTHGL